LNIALFNTYSISMASRPFPNTPNPWTREQHIRLNEMALNILIIFRIGSTRLNVPFYPAKYFECVQLPMRTTEREPDTITK
jgi:hypothetical protein